MPKAKPKTQHEMIDQLWYAHYGTNGDGMGSRLGKLETSQAQFNEMFVAFMENRAITCPMRAHKGMTVGRKQFCLAVVALIVSTLTSVSAVLVSTGVIPV